LKEEDGERHAFLGWGGDVASGDKDEAVGKKAAVAVALHESAVTWYLRVLG
jgi:hypothetical protein